MRRLIVTLIATAALGAVSAPAADRSLRRMPRSVLEDKVRGGWAGQVIGVTYGAPTEFQSLGRIITTEIPWDATRVKDALSQDDLYVEMTFAEVTDTIGLDATSEQYGEMLKDSKYELWHANAGARRALNRGIRAPWSGHPKHNVHANDIDFQIEADFIGLMAPGLPASANEVAERVGRVMSYGDGLYGGMFVAGMYAAAFFEQDPRRVVEQGLLSIPAESGYARVIRDVLRWAAEHPDDWRTTWGLIEARWNRDDPCPDGALTDFNIDARLNGAYVALGLLYGNGDMARTLEVATRAGQDSDCNPSSAAGVLGVILGYQGIPELWRSGIPAMADAKFAYTRYTLNEIVGSTLVRAEKLIRAAGGEVGPEEVAVPWQPPQAPPLEQWDPGPPILRLDAFAPAWAWKGAWSVETVGNPWAEWKVKTTDAAGDEVAFAFEGSGVAIVGHCFQDGGRADVYLDGARVGMIDAWAPERTNDNDYWHVTGLVPGAHRVRLVVRADQDPRSKGRKVRIERAIVYGTKGPLAPAARRIPVILDTDIGSDIDDTWALAMLLNSPELDLKLVTTATGDTVYRARIVARLLEIAGRTDVPIGIGPQQSQENDGPQAPWVAGYELDHYPGKVHRDGVGALVDMIMASPEPITLIAIGPVPNVAAALEREPRIAERARFVGMHGSLRVGYGGSPELAAEANVKGAAEACRAVFAAPWDVTITPLDTCGLVQLAGEKYQRVAASEDPLVQALLENYRVWWPRCPWCKEDSAADPRRFESRSSTLFDTVAVYLAFSERLLEIEDLGVRVTDDGHTLINESRKPLRCATRWRDLGAFEDLLVERLVNPAGR